LAAPGPDTSGISLSADGTLTVTGSSAADRIWLRTRRHRFAGEPGARDVLEVISSNAGRDYYRRFALAAVQRVRVRAGAGDDEVIAHAQVVPFPSLVLYGEAGNDR